MSEFVFSCRGLTKHYGSVRALTGLDFDLRPGEVRALLGKNGAGKSTLVNLISGSVHPDSGTMEIDGEPIRWSGAAAARAGGIAVVHQEFSLVPGLSVAENVTLGRWPRKGGFVDGTAMRADAAKAIERLGISLPLGREVGTLSLADQQVVEIAKALVGNPRVLILDEPTSALNAHEVEILLGLVRRLASTGMGILYVSHRMKEIPLVADTFTVLRDGEHIATAPIETATSVQIAELISGESSEHVVYEKRDRREAPIVLEVKDLSVPDRLDGISFALHEGEVLGVAGLLGSGRTELLESIFGTHHEATGQVFIRGKSHSKRDPRKMLDLGVAYTSEDRKGAGIVPELSIGENIIFSARGRLLPKFWVSVAEEARIIAETMMSMSVRASSPAQEIGELSGGNQQKGVIGRALAAKMRILLLDEPTRGVDLHAKAQIYGLIRALADEGVSSIFVSSELEEIAEVCDRVLVLRDGRIHEELIGEEASAERVLALAMHQENDND